MPKVAYEYAFKEWVLEAGGDALMIRLAFQELNGEQSDDNESVDNASSCVHRGVANFGELPAGGTSLVYVTSRGGDPAILKLVKPELSAGSLGTELNARFHREAEILSTLSGKRAPKLYGRGDYCGSPFIVMEQVGGRGLGESMSNGAPRSVPVALRLVNELLIALSDLHPGGIIHRDLSPANIFVQNDGTIKLIDFGFSAYPAQLAITYPGTIRATFGYIWLLSNCSQNPSRSLSEPTYGQSAQFSIFC